MSNFAWVSYFWLYILSLIVGILSAKWNIFVVLVRSFITLSSISFFYFLLILIYFHYFTNFRKFFSIFYSLFTCQVKENPGSLFRKKIDFENVLMEVLEKQLWRTSLVSSRLGLGRGIFSLVGRRAKFSGGGEVSCQFHQKWILLNASTRKIPKFSNTTWIQLWLLKFPSYGNIYLLFQPLFLPSYNSLIIQ